MAAPTALVSGKSGKGKKAPRTRVWFWADECKYEVVLGRARSLGWKLITDEKNEHNSNLFWIDVAAIHERFRTIQPWQVINHFPGMPNIARKNRMGQNLNRMLKLMPTEYNFYPRTWVLPGEMSDFEKNFDSQGNSSKIFIIKPDTGCQGKGIFLTKRLDAVPRTENVVAQVYLKKPMVIDDYKFDLRIYCYVSSVRPLRIYLFHDGLVRMCTEKYVKPTKQNLDQSCMHLTNYALNKSNSNYTKSNAQSSSDSSQQEDSHKRSLVWFMEWVRNTHGDAKADWLWRRIGILCVRTILSISPILSRDYLQYFKSFNNIPVDIEALQAQYNASKEAAKTGGSKDKDGSSTKKNTSESSKSTEKSNKTVEVSSQESGDEDDEEDLSNNGEENEESEEKNADTPAESDTNAEKTPKFRGSRAFEILGFDIMLDDKMKPWLIEVNHLPSFGTDSPLDLDIKKRLMEQVFATLPVRMDDDVAYSMFHQMESEKRLMKKREDPSVAEEKRAKEQQSTRSRSVERSSAPSRQRTEEPSPEQIAEEEKLLEERRDREAKEKELTIVAQQKASAALNTAAVAAAQALCSGVEMPHFMFTVTVDDFGETTIITSSIIDGEEHSQRLLEIIEILTGIYEEYCPEKISKIDRLLYKYQGREEEFLQFVVQKYSVNGAMLAGVIEKVLIKYHSITIPKISIKKAASEAEMEKKIAAAHSTKSSSARAPEKPKPWGSSARAGETRHSRSVSPPGAAGARQANWKGGNAEEEEAYREEIIATHVPTEEDEWMRFEMKHLTQFTRIFPALVTDAESKKEGRSDGKQLSEAEAAELEAKDEEEEEAEENGKAPMVSSSPKLKIASFVEIMVQAFIQDRRQTMRFHCPLGGRSREVAGDSSLPPLHEPFRSGGTSSLNKGGSGWRPPPPVKTEKTVPKVPTQSQVEVAKRLTQGMSSAPQAYSGKSKPPAGPNSATNAVFQLDRDTYDDILAANEANSNMNNPAMNPYPNQIHPGGQGMASPQQMNQMTMQQQMNMFPGYGGVGSGGVGLNMIPGYNNPSEGSMHPRISKLVEESRQARLRLEQSKSTAASVLRQQVFHFDPVAANNANVALVAAAYGNGTVPPQMMIGGPLNIGGSNVLAAGANVVGNSNNYGTSGGSGGSNRYSNSQNQRSGAVGTSSAGNINGGRGQGASGRISDENSQEEMLRSYFPGWF